MSSPASEVARRLGENAEAVCRRYLSNGRREGNYWMVGDISNSPGRSLYVRLASSANGGAPGKWTDAAIMAMSSTSSPRAAAIRHFVKPSRKHGGF